MQRNGRAAALKREVPLKQEDPPNLGSSCFSPHAVSPPYWCDIAILNRSSGSMQ